jgi:peptide/nickel transport system substrate-binding protein
MPMRSGILRLWLAALGLALAATPAAAEEKPKYGGTLTYLIPADSPPTFDAQREQTYATIHSAAPFYSMLVRVNPMNPGSTTDIVCDVCTEVPEPTDGGKIWTFKIRDDVKFHNGDKLTADDVAASFNKIAFPPQGVTSPRSSNFDMVEKIEAPDPSTVVFRLKFATGAFLPAVADPYNWIYQKKTLDSDPHWYEKNILGSGPFKFVEYQTGQSIKGVRNPDYHHKGLPYLDGFHAIYAPKQSTQLDAIRADRAAMEFRGYPPSAIKELKDELGDKIVVQEHDWNCGHLIWFNHQKKPFDDVRVRKALTLAIDRWGGLPGLSQVAIMRRVGSIIFPGSPLAPSREQLEQIPGFWPDIEKSRAEARRLLKEAGVENLTFEMLNRATDQPYKYNGIWAVDQWSKIGVKVTQRVMPVGPWFAALRSGDFGVGLSGNCQGIVNPLLDVHAFLPRSVNSANFGYYEDPELLEIHEKALHSSDPQEQKELMHQFAKRVMGDEAHIAFLGWWYRLVPHRSYVNGWKIGPSHYLNQDLGTIWLSAPQCGSCTDQPPAADKRAEAQSK